MVRGGNVTERMSRPRAPCGEQRRFICVKGKKAVAVWTLKRQLQFGWYHGLFRPIDGRRSLSFFKMIIKGWRKSIWSGLD